MARPKVKEPKKQYTLMMKPSTIAEIDRLAEKHELSRSQLMANLIEMGLDDAKILDRLGVIKLVMAAGKMKNSLKQKFLKGDAKIDSDGELTIK